MYYTAATVNQFQAEGLLDQNLQSDLESIKKERMTHQSSKQLPVS